MLASVHPPAEGFELDSTLPASSTATHSDALGQETPVRARPPSIDWAAHAPAEGSAFTNAYPRPSTATQGPPGAHASAFNDWPESIAEAPHDGLAAVGSVVLNASPWRSTARHSDSDGQASELGVLPGSKLAGADQPSEGAPCAGSEDAPRASITVNTASSVLAIGPTEGRLESPMDCKPERGLGVAVSRDGAAGPLVGVALTAGGAVRSPARMSARPAPAGLARCRRAP